ncbi:hypothetical protein IID27_02990 [Patescibacteria group bacterium]|nr:hypothetical protein [Patescibacteria group bacterium]
MVTVVPAIIAENLDDLRRQVKVVSPYVDLVQVDIMDGKFAPSLSWPYLENQIDELRSIKSKEELLGASGVDYNLDVMIENPEAGIDEWIDAGVRSLIIHIESTSNLQDIIDRARARGTGVALALQPETPNDGLYEWIEQIDFVQFMGNQKIGYHGVELDKSVLDKIRDLRNKYKKLIIGVDIGVNLKTAPELVRAGANKLVSGSVIFKSGDVGGTIEALAHAGEK